MTDNQVLELLESEILKAARERLRVFYSLGSTLKISIIDSLAGPSMCVHMRVGSETHSTGHTVILDEGRIHGLLDGDAPETWILHMAVSAVVALSDALVVNLYKMAVRDEKEDVSSTSGGLVGLRGARGEKRV